MRKLFILIWLLIPVMIISLHYGPGQRYNTLNTAANHVERAEKLQDIAEKTGTPEDWQKVVDAYQDSLAFVPEEQKLAVSHVKLAATRARMYKGELVEAMQELEVLQQEVQDKNLPIEHQNQVRDTLAHSQFGAAWVMRLEGAETDLWTTQAEKARQNFRLLAEKALEQQREEALDHQKNLESTIRMEQMDASVIKGLPLPKEAQNGTGQGVSDKLKKGKEAGEGSSEGIGQTQEGDARGKGAGSGQRPEGVGS